MTRRRARKEASRGRILRSAGLLLRRRGIAKASVQEIMRASGLTVGAFYAHFRSKDDLLLTVIREGGADMWRRELAACGDLPPAARRQALVDSYLSPKHRDHADDGCILPASVAEIAAADAPLRTASPSRAPSRVWRAEVARRCPAASPPASAAPWRSSP